MQKGVDLYRFYVVTYLAKVSTLNNDTHHSPESQIY